jgi:NRPS condensation-like uncharacterized protein
MANAQDPQILLVLSFDGRLDDSRMERAVRLSVDAEPLLGCRFVDRKWRPHWERRKDLDHVRLFNLTKGVEVPKALEEVLTTPMDPAKGPLVEVQILRSVADTLCIKLSHVVGDGGGIMEYGDLLAGIYRQLGSDPGYVPIPNVGGRRGLRQISDRLGPWDRLRLLRSSLEDLIGNNYPFRYWTFPSMKIVCPPSVKRTFVIRQIGPDRFGATREYGHKHQATLNDVMLAAFCRALTAVIRPKPDTPLRLRMTADLRRYLPTRRGETICTLSGFVHLNLGTELGTTFHDTCMRVRDCMNRAKSGFPGLGDFPLAALLFKGFPFFLARKLFLLMVDQLIRKGNIPPIFTNVGRVEPERFAFGDLEVADGFVAPPVVFPPFFSLGMTSCGDTLTLCTGFCGSTVERSKVEDLLERLEDELPRGEGTVRLTVD